MANTSKVSGLTPVAYLGGADWDGRGRLYHIDTGDTNGFYVGDPVALKAGTATLSGEDYGLPTITVGNANGTNVGVILAVGTVPRGGPLITASDLTKTWRPAAAQTVPYFALVADDPNIIFEIQEGGSGTAFTVTSASKNANFALAAPAAGSYVSGCYLDNGTAAATTSTYNLKLLGLAQKYDNGAFNTYGAAAKWLCLLNNHQYRTGVAGI